MRRRWLRVPTIFAVALAAITISCDSSDEPTALAEHVVGGAARAVAVAQLQIVGGLNGYAHAVNNRGEVAGENCGQGCLTRAFYWSETGGTEDLGTLSGYTRSFAYEITENSTVFGSLQCWSGDAACGGVFAEQRVRWDRVGGAWTITPLAGCALSSSDIVVNNNNQCVGRPAGASQLALQTLNGGAVVGSENLPKLDPAGTEGAYEVSDAMMVAGHASTGGQTVPVIWFRRAGAWAILRLNLPATHNIGSALDISEPDALGRVRVSGRTAAAGGRGYSAMRWTLDPDGLGGLQVTTTTALEVGKGRSDSHGEAISASGDVAGHANIQPLYWPIGGGAQTLPLPNGGGSGRAFDINNNRWVVGYVFDRTSRCDRAAIWRLQ